jgi:predicted pyridoxine 5'-phosphate oxidase superfamily flavin-nucleotide-binding protein
MDASDFHEGEQRVRARAKLDANALRMSRYFRSYMPEQHRELFERLPFVVIGALDAHGQPWATLLEGPPGFVAAPDERHLRLHASLPAADPLASELHAGSSIGLLGIEPQTRRRNRANGVVDAIGERLIDIDVRQSFGNCPKYIQARTVHFELQHRIVPQAEHKAAIDERLATLIAQADVFFIATAHPLAGRDTTPAHGADVSHRGGRPGFVQVHGDALTIEDYAGNNFFNTLGNLELEQRAGLLFISMNDGALLHLAVRAEIEWLSTSQPGRKGTDRRLQFHLERAVYVTQRSALKWGPGETSPFL